MKVKGFIILLFLFGSSIYRPVYADSPVELLTADLSPFSIKDKKRPGFMVEIAQAIEECLGRKADVQFLPWPRAQRQALTRANKVIFPVTRISARETRYSWLIDVVPMELVFITKTGHKLSLDEARKLRWISVQQDTPFDHFLRENGFRNLSPSPLAAKNHVKLLASGRVDAWFTARVLAYEGLKDYHPDYFTMSDPVVRYQVYIAASKDFPEDLKQQYRSVYADLQADGTIDRILQKYGYKATGREDW